MRMSMRRFTRLTNGFSKKVENLEHMVALHFMHYNFVRIHKSLHTTPAMAAGVSNKLWEISDIVSLIPEEVPKKRGSYKKENKNLKQVKSTLFRSHNGQSRAASNP